jgi:2-dehydrotetronate isomerase
MVMSDAADEDDLPQRHPVLSANLGFLFTDLPFPDRIRAAADAGFTHVEFHDQAQADLRGVAQAVAETGVQVTAINTFHGPTMGRAAIPTPGFAEDFRAALGAAQAVGAAAIHVVAGRVFGPQARATYLRNLDWALARTDRPLLLEPICGAAIPGYHLGRLEDFAEVTAALPHPQLKLLADWFHLGTLYGPHGALARITTQPRLAHLQLARLPDRGDPMPADLPLWPALRAFAMARLLPIGLEYHPTRPVAELRAALLAEPGA